MLDVIAHRHGLQGPIRFSARPPRLERPVSAGAKPAPVTANSSQAELTTLPRPPFAVRALNHLTFGATAASIAEFNALGGNDTARLTAFLNQQLNPASIDDSAFDTRLANAGYTTLAKPLTQLWSEHVLNDPV